MHDARSKPPGLPPQAGLTRRAALLMVLAANQPYSLPSEASCEKSARIFWGNGRVHDRDWPALMQLAESIDPSFRN